METAISLTCVRLARIPGGRPARTQSGTVPCEALTNKAKALAMADTLPKLLRGAGPNADP